MLFKGEKDNQEKSAYLPWITFFLSHGVEK